MRRIGISVCLLIIIVFSVATISATTDVKGLLNSWYVQLFDKKSSERSTEIAKQITSLENSIRTLFDQSTKEIDRELDYFIDTSTAISEEEISTHQEQYEQQLEATKKQLILELNDQELTTKEFETIEQDMEEIAAEILRNILSD